ncbi:MAG: aspartate kinase [Methanomassiliicoccales archaeon]|nr:MAG: aspartate kinase [Methanomassiliicoccales archaeon]
MNDTKLEYKSEYGVPMKIMKFGGSTIKTPDMIKKVADIIKNEEDVKVVVVSALHGQTNEIREYLKTVETESNDIDSFIANILEKHENMVKTAISNEKIQKEVIVKIKNIILKLERLLYGVAYTEELTPKTQDLILSSAERMSAYLMEGVLNSMVVPACAYEADQIGIVTDGIFYNATANLQETEKNLCEVLDADIKKGVVPVITGFFGRDSEGRTTTFGKNGSDYSAAVIAYALSADVLELWKDVNGFMSADPILVPNAHTMDKLSYDEAAELAYFGIGLLHPRTVGPVRLKDIPIVIKNIIQPQKKGTIIMKKGFKSKNVIKSVVYTNDLVEIKVSGPGAGYRSGVLSLVSSTLSSSNINIYSVNTSQTYLSMLIHKNDLEGCLKALKDIQSGVIEGIEHQKDIALVCVVGEGSRNIKGLAGKIFSAVASSDVNVEMMSAGASEVAAHFIIKKEGLKRTIEAIHRAFCEEPSST